MSLQANHLARIMALLEKIYSGDGKTLYFPLMQNIAYSKQQFELLDKDLAEGNSAQAMQDISSQSYKFSQVVNQVIDPSSIIAHPPTGDFFWDVYADILDPATTDFARNASINETDTIAYNKAIAVLYTNTDQEQLSEKWMRYKECKANYETALSTVKSREADVLLSNDAVQLQNWPAEKEQLEKKLRDAQDDWNISGFRSQVQLALEVKNAYESRSPLLKQTTLMEKLKQFTVTDIRSADKYCVTTYSPQGLFNTAWLKHTITKAMLSNIPVDNNERIVQLLKAIGASQPDNAVQEISFEIAECKIYRPWAEEDIFAQRYWKFRDPAKQLSNGGADGKLLSGECPAYISGLVFIRNIEIRLLKPANTQPEAGTISPFLLSKTAVMTLQQKQPPKKVAPVHGIVGLKRIQPAANSVKKTTTVFGFLNKTRIKSAAVRPPVRKPPPARTGPFHTFNVATMHTSTSGTTAAPIVQVEKYLQNEIQVLAFICKNIPKSPNPDETYQW